MSVGRRTDDCRFPACVPVGLDADTEQVWGFVCFGVFSVLRSVFEFEFSGKDRWESGTYRFLASRLATFAFDAVSVADILDGEVDGCGELELWAED